MNLIKKILVSSLVAASMLAASSAFAGKDDAKVAKALTDTIAKLEETISAAESNYDKEAFQKGLGEAKQLQKEYRYEQTERKRQYAAEHIKNSLAATKDDKKDVAITELKAALAGFQEMKPIYDAAH
jgi:large subunit ribosomal protein L7/L12